MSVAPYGLHDRLRRWVGLCLLQMLGLLGCSVPAAVLAQTSAVASPRLGVFYFPGWKEGEMGLAYPRPWEKIKPFPEREPLLGWYDEGSAPVMEQHLAWMADHAIDFSVFDWYWDGRKPVLDHALRAYRASKGKARVAYALMWANHEGVTFSESQLRALARHVVQEHFSQAEYLKVDGKPVLFLMAPELLEKNAQTIGVPQADLLAMVQAVAQSAGLPGVLLLGGAGGGVNVVTANAKRWGYGGYFVYNYSAGIAGTRGQARGTHSYAELDEVYREHWDWFMTRGDLPYVVPMSSGWDQRPWGGSKDPKRDLSVSTVEQFAAHLTAGRDVIRRQPAKTLNMGVVCCWNEFGEGSYIEPTKGLGMRYIEAVRSVFGQR